MIIEHTKHKQKFTINTGKHDPVMICALLGAKIHDMYDVVVDGDRVVVSKVSCIEI